MYLLTKLFASQTATWHVYFRIHHTYKSILNFNNCQREARGPLLKNGKSRQHVACRSLQTAWCSPERSILKLLCTVHYRHAKTSMILACWRPQWHPLALGWGSTCDEVVYPSELPMGLSTLLSRGPHSLSAAHWQPSVEPPRTCSSSSPTQAPSKGSSVQWSRSPVPVNRHGAQHTPVVRLPFTFGHILRPGFEFSPRARAGPGAAAVEDEGFGLPGVLVMLSTLSNSSQIFATQSVAASLRPHPNKRAMSPPRSHVAQAGSRNEVILGRGAACWPGTHPLQLLTVYCFDAGISNIKKTKNMLK